MSDAKDETADDRRAEERAPITLRVDYKRLNTFFADYTRNISHGGTFIRTTRPLEVGTEFVFVLSLPSPPAPEGSPAGDSPGGGEGEGVTKLDLAGVVKWVVPESDATQEKPAGMGIQFVFADEADRRRVEVFVADLMHASLGPHLAGKLLGGTKT